MIEKGRYGALFCNGPFLVCVKPKTVSWQRDSISRLHAFYPGCGLPFPTQ